MPNSDDAITVVHEINGTMDAIMFLTSVKNRVVMDKEYIKLINDELGLDFDDDDVADFVTALSVLISVMRKALSNTFKG